MNFIIPFAGAVLGNIMTPKIIEMKQRLCTYMEYPKIRINTLTDSIQGQAIFTFLVKKLKNMKAEENIFLSSVNICNANIAGNIEMCVVPQKSFEYIEYYYYSLISFGIKIIDGNSQVNFVYEIYGNYYQTPLESIIKEYEDVFYRMEKNILAIPIFRFEETWIFDPLSTSTISNGNLSSFKQQEVISYVFENICSIKSILLYGNLHYSKKQTSYFIGEKLRRKIYITNNLLRPGNFIDSIRKVPPDSIILIKYIDDVFPKGITQYNVNADTILGLFDFLAKNVLVIFITNKLDEYQKIPHLFNETRIQKIFG